VLEFVKLAPRQRLGTYALRESSGDHGLAAKRGSKLLAWLPRVQSFRVYSVRVSSSGTSASRTWCSVSIFGIVEAWSSV